MLPVAISASVAIVLGVAMVYDAQGAHGRVHCRLAWAPSPQAEWQWADEVGRLVGAELIPLGAEGDFDSHVRRAAPPQPKPDPHAAAPGPLPDPGPD